MAIDIYWPFIFQREDGAGGRRHTVYWPGGDSGATVADGVDLGRLENAIFNGLPEPLKDKLLPYLGLAGLVAHKVVMLHPLTLTDEECEELEAPKRAEMTAALASHYKRDADVDFGSIPPAAQTVMMSVQWQYGAIWKDTPHFWSACCRQDWPGAIAELRNFGDDYPTRRNAEADYLQANL